MKAKIEEDEGEEIEDEIEDSENEDVDSGFDEFAQYSKQ